MKTINHSRLSGWICELGELDSTLKKEQAELKAFITQSFYLYYNLYELISQGLMK